MAIDEASRMVWKSSWFCRDVLAQGLKGKYDNPSIPILPHPSDVVAILPLTHKGKSSVV